MLARTLLGGMVLLSLLFWLRPGLAAEDVGSPARHPARSAEARGSDRAVTVIRGSPTRPTATAAQETPAQPQIVRAGVIGTGNNLWYVDADQRIHACWLSGTGYVNSLRVTCTR